MGLWVVGVCCLIRYHVCPLRSSRSSIPSSASSCKRRTAVLAVWFACSIVRRCREPELTHSLGRAARYFRNRSLSGSSFFISIYLLFNLLCVWRAVEFVV